MKLDLSKEFKAYYSGKAVPELHEFGRVAYLCIKGKGDPSGDAFASDIECLYSVAYALKFECKAAGNDFVVAKLEGLWSFDADRFGSPTMAEAPRVIPRNEWNYTLMIRLPDWVDNDAVSRASEQVISRRQLPGVARVFWQTMDEGLVLQVLHIGPFSAEPETLAGIARFSEEQGLVQNGTHHEIYLSDFRKTPQDKLRTLLREPVRRI